MTETIRDKIAALYEKHYFFVYYRALAFLRHTADAEDAVSEVFVRVTKGLRKKPDLVITKTSLLHVTTHVCIDRWRTNPSRREDLLSPQDDFRGMFRTEDSHALLMVHQILERLGPKLHDIAIYRYVDRMTIDEIAHAMGLGEKTVRRRIAKIDKRIRLLTKIE